MPTLTLNHFTFAELFSAAGLTRLDQDFLSYVKTKNANVYEKILIYRENSIPFTALEISELLLLAAPILESFLISFFNIEEAAAIAQIKTTSQNPIADFKKYYVLRRAKKELAKRENYPAFAESTAKIKTALAASNLQADDLELAIALLGNHYLIDLDQFKNEIDILVQWCTQALGSAEGQKFVSGWVSFHLPERIEYDNLVPTITDSHGRLATEAANIRLRDGFKLTDPRMTAREIQNEVNYCIYCHDHDGDFCSKGFPVKKAEPHLGLKKNPLDNIMTGCPLEEKISEMNLLKRDGLTLAALAMVMVDNPMCPATGHRICNDCMKSCIYQKQEPVNIPQIETAVLTDVLHLPWGVEIYDLLTRWNPLRQKQWVMQPYNGLKILIAGMGPAGFTLAHHLLMEGFAVVGFDGLKIEPLPESLLNNPIRNFADLKESLDERLMAGFGGVAEYGITVRWDKNFLKLIYLSLMRRPTFQVFGSVRLGGTIKIEDAWELGFDHFVLAVGAGLPKALPIPGSMAPGMRQANDFLMALQLGSAAKSSSLTNLQLRLPAVIIGGGLTGVDTATEAQAYYIAQVEKMLTRYETLATIYGENFIAQELDAASQEILAEYLRHGHAVKQERLAAQQQKRQPNFLKLIQEWGGVTIVYRRSMQESPAYINNHEELKKALEEGIYYLEGLEPKSANLNQHGHVEALVCHKRIRNLKNEWETSAEEIYLPARSILVATGTQPNIAYEFEYHGTFNRLGLQYQHYEDRAGELNAAHGVLHCKDKAFGPFTSYQHSDHRVSLVGDTHPVFHGSVVKAIASGKQTYPKILAILKNKLKQRGNLNEYQEFSAKMNFLFQATVLNLHRKTKNMIELTIKAPLAAKNFRPGQFYRLQNYETFAAAFDHTLLLMEPLAISPAECAADSLKFIIAEELASSKLCATLKVGQPVALMGPTGVRAKIPNEHETIMIIGNFSSFSLVRSYGQALRRAGNHVIFLCYLNSTDELYCQSELEKATDSIIWLIANNEKINLARASDRFLTGNDVLDALKHYTTSGLNMLPLADVDRLFVIGSSNLLRQFQVQQKNLIKDYFIKSPKIFAAVYGNMQCMLKGVCAQCLQWQIDPETGQRTKAVFACSWQDQPLEMIDIDHMEQRKMQNTVHEVLNNKWIDHVYQTETITRI